MVRQGSLADVRKTALFRGCVWPETGDLKGTDSGFVFEKDSEQGVVGRTG